MKTRKELAELIAKNLPPGVRQDARNGYGSLDKYKTLAIVEELEERNAWLEEFRDVVKKALLNEVFLKGSFPAGIIEEPGMVEAFQRIKTMMDAED